MSWWLLLKRCDEPVLFDRGRLGGEENAWWWINHWCWPSVFHASCMQCASYAKPRRPLNVLLCCRVYQYQPFARGHKNCAGCASRCVCLLGCCHWWQQRRWRRHVWRRLRNRMNWRLLGWLTKSTAECFSADQTLRTPRLCYQQQTIAWTTFYEWLVGTIKIAAPVVVQKSLSYISAMSS